MNIDQRKLPGFLTFLIVILLALNPALILLSTLSEIITLNEQYPKFQQLSVYSTFLWAVWINASVFSIISVVIASLMIIYRRPFSIYLCVVGLWVLSVGLVLSIAIVIPYSLTGNFSDVHIFRDKPFEFIFRLIIVMLWTLYLLMSKEVAAAYGMSNAAVRLADIESDRSDTALPKADDNDEGKIDEHAPIPLKTYSGKEQEVEYVRDREILDKMGIHYNVQQALIVTIFVNPVDYDKAIIALTT